MRMEINVEYDEEMDYTSVRQFLLYYFSLEKGQGPSLCRYYLPFTNFTYLHKNVLCKVWLNFTR